MASVGTWVFNLIVAWVELPWVSFLGRREGASPRGFSVVVGFDVRWGAVAVAGVEAGGVKPVDPFQGRELDVLDGACTALAWRGPRDDAGAADRRATPRARGQRTGASTVTDPCITPPGPYARRAGAIEISQMSWPVSQVRTRNRAVRATYPKGGPHS